METYGAIASVQHLHLSLLSLLPRNMFGSAQLQQPFSITSLYGKTMKPTSEFVLTALVIPRSNTNRYRTHPFLIVVNFNSPSRYTASNMK